MKITIDTKEDSPSDIRKVISLLSRMIENNQNSNIFEDSGSDAFSEKNAFANMFANDSKKDKSETNMSKTKKDSEDLFPTMIEY